MDSDNIQKILEIAIKITGLIIWCIVGLIGFVIAWKVSIGLAIVSLFLKPALRAYALIYFFFDYNVPEAVYNLITNTV